MRDLDNLKEWRKENIRRYEIYVNKKSQADIWNWLETKGNIRNYLLSLVEEDMKKNVSKTNNELEKKYGKEI